MTYRLILALVMGLLFTGLLYWKHPRPVTAFSGKEKHRYTPYFAYWLLPGFLLLIVCFLPLMLPRGGGPFCRFSIQAPQAPGVYLWVAEGQLLYIGETVNLRQRFNTGYGAISPRNCYAGGQSTNCKMNQVVLDYYNRGTPIQLYFFPTQRYKQVELELLGKLNTPYNVKDN